MSQRRPPESAAPLDPAGMQAFVQSAVLRMVADESAVHPARILRTIPHADERDVARAVEVLVNDGCLLVGARRATYEGDLAPAELAAKGRARLL
jgi:hypothetical protein